MKISQRLHHRIRIKNFLMTLVILMCIGLLTWLSARFHGQIDLTAGGQNTLSQASIKLLSNITGDVQIKAYLPKNKPVMDKITYLVDRYKQVNPNITVEFITPESEPDSIRELAIGPEGAIIVEYQGRTEKLSVFNESTFSNSLLKLANAEQRWISLLTGHGERSVTGTANHDLAIFGKELTQRNIQIIALNLAELEAIPDNTALLVIAGPAVNLLAGETEKLLDYIDQGGNLLWLSDPGENKLAALADLLGIRFLPGTIVDTNSKIYGVEDPRFVLISSYYQHPITRNLQAMTVYPIAAALEMDTQSDFQATPLLTSVPRSWTETGTISGKIRFDADSEEREGPLDLGFALTREYLPGKEQRIVIIGDGDFLSNAYIGNVGNTDMGLRIIDWLSHADDYIEIQPKSAQDRQMNFDKMTMSLIGFGFLLVLPVSLWVTGWMIWRKRKNR